jgi:hypothetical protein
LKENNFLYRMAKFLHSRQKLQFKAVFFNVFLMYKNFEHYSIIDLKKSAR